MTAPTPRYIVLPGSRNFERVVVDTLTEKIVWGPRRDIRAAEREAARLNRAAAKVPVQNPQPGETVAASGRVILRGRRS